MSSSSSKIAYRCTSGCALSHAFISWPRDPSRIGVTSKHLPTCCSTCSCPDFTNLHEEERTTLHPVFLIIRFTRDASLGSMPEKPQDRSIVSALLSTPSTSRNSTFTVRLRKCAVGQARTPTSHWRQCSLGRQSPPQQTFEHLRKGYQCRVSGQIRSGGNETSMVVPA